MKPILLALAGMTIYAATGVAIERWLGKASTMALVLLFAAPMVAIASVVLLVQRGHGPVSFPRGGLLWLTILLGVLYFFADYFYLGAFTSGGNALVISTIAIMAPVLTAIARHFLVGGWPNGYQMAGYVMAAGAVLLLAKGGATV